MFCICSNVKASISLTQRWICNGLKSNRSAHFQGYCSFGISRVYSLSTSFFKLSQIFKNFSNTFIGENVHISEPMHFKLTLFKGQLYSYPHSLVRYYCSYSVLGKLIVLVFLKYNLWFPNLCLST